jgi:hypothetical protein
MENLDVQYKIYNSLIKLAVNIFEIIDPINFDAEKNLVTPMGYVVKKQNKK